VTAKNSENSDAPAERPGQGLFRRHRKLFLWLMLGWTLIIVVLIWLASGPQNEPFVYQVF